MQKIPGKESENEIKKEWTLFVKYSKLENSPNVIGVSLCALKYFLLLGEFDKAKNIN